MKTRLIFSVLVLCFLSLAGHAQTVKLLSYNIHHGNPPSEPGKIDLEAIAKVINEADADIIGLQEIDIKVSRSNLENQALKLAELTGMDYYFSKGIDLEEGYYGTLILTKHKIVGKRRYDLPMPVPSENRSLAIVDVELPNGLTVAVANTHLDLKPDNRISQVKFINEIADWYDERPFILLGDLNARPGSEPITILEEKFVRNTEANILTIPVINPKSEIDYIMVGENRGFKWLQYHAIQEHYASDHLPVFAELEF